jgi:hypothetical protein
MDTTQIVDRPQHADPADMLRLSAVSHNRLLLVVPALCALAYPSLSSLLSAGLVTAHGSAAPNGAIVWVGVIASLALAFTVMAVSFVFGFGLGSKNGGTREDLRARSIAHLAFATPSLYVGFANVAGVFRAQSTLLAAWIIFWAAMTAIVLVRPRLPSSKPVGMTPVVHRRLALSHGISASMILLLFVLPHIVNHLAGFWSGTAHIELMKAARHVYRDDIVQPVLLAVIGFQILSGTVLLRRRLTLPSDFLGTLQTMCGAYIGIYFLAHMTAVFAARYAGTDTNWNWLTNNDTGMLVSLSSLRLIAHYWVGPIAIVTHLACGLRMVLLEREVSPAIADRLVPAFVTVGAVVSSVILIALFSVHIA